MAIRKDAEDIDNGTLRRDPVPRRSELIALISEKMEKYNKDTTFHRNLSPLKAADQSQIGASSPTLTLAPAMRHQNAWSKMLRTGLNYDGAIDPQEILFIHKNDLMPIIHTQKSAIRNVFEKHVFFRIHGLLGQKPPEDAELGELEARKYISNAYVEVITAVCILVAGLLLLILPLWILSVFETRNSKLGLITALIITFMLLMWVATTAKHLERLGATAA